MKVVSVVGARPQFIKASVVSQALAATGVQGVLIHTGQHYDPDVSRVFFEDLGLMPPARNLGVGSGSHGVQTGRMLEAVEAVLMGESPDWVLVFGDTNSTLAGALAASKLRIPVAHVEAGLRSFNRAMPEEVNRVVTDHLSDLLLAPTPTAMENLAREGLGSAALLVGDVMYDVALQQGGRAERESAILSDLGLESGDYVLATVHRAENTDDPTRLHTICRALTKVAATMRVVLPLHPRTRAALGVTGLLDEASGAVKVIPPVGYLDMSKLERHAAVIATDSGGVQKEAFFHRVACVTLRDETEWVELVAAGWNRLAPPHDADQVASAILAAVGTQGEDVLPYGDGHAADRVVEALVAAAAHG